MPQFEFDWWHTDRGEAWVRLRGELDIAAVAQLNAGLDEAFAAAGAVNIDLRQLAFLDGAGLGALVSARARADRDRQQLKLIRADGQFESLLKVTGLDELFVTRAAAHLGRPQRTNEAGIVAHLHCPRCGLTVRPPPHETAGLDCPRCLGRSQLSIPMAILDSPTA